MAAWCKFDVPTTYDSPTVISPDWTAEDAGDLEPAGIGSRGAAVKLSGLRIYRDKYYIATLYSNERLRQCRSTRSELQRIFADPDQWYAADDVVARPRSIFDPARGGMSNSRSKPTSSCRWETTARKARTAGSGFERTTMSSATCSSARPS